MLEPGVTQLKKLPVNRKYVAVSIGSNNLCRCWGTLQIGQCSWIRAGSCVMVTVAMCCSLTTSNRRLTRHSTSTRWSTLTHSLSVSR